MHKRFVLFNVEMGIYLGSCMGLGFWSRLDSVDQEMAVTFESEEQAIKVSATWEIPVKNLQAIPVECADNKYVTHAECVAAGLPGWMN